MASVTEAFFMPDGHGGQLHAVLHRPTDDAPRACVVLVQAWGPEMNFSRRHLAQASRALAAAGAMVLVVDLHGSGDSHGRAEDGTWSRWADDLRLGLRWLQARHPDLPQWVWAHRAGALVVAAAWPALRDAHLLLWQPVASLADLRREWERQAAASALARGRPPAAAVQALREAWRAGRAVEIAGTAVSAALALDDALPALTSLAPAAGTQLVWIELGRPQPAQASAAAQRVMAAWAQGGGAAHWLPVDTEPFWQLAEAQRRPALAERTVQAVLGTA